MDDKGIGKHPDKNDLYTTVHGETIRGENANEHIFPLAESEHRVMNWKFIVPSTARLVSKHGDHPIGVLGVITRADDPSPEHDHDDQLARAPQKNRSRTQSHYGK